jgi:glycosyltransferase involved in cell wall biosynthesis
MPVYNREGSMRRAIDSVLGQDFGDFEFIIVSDGSTDGTADVIAEYGDQRIRFFDLPTNRGANAARNEGLKQAKSPIISFIDSDDAFLPLKLGFVCDYFDKHRDVDVLIDSFEVRYPAETGRRKALRINETTVGSENIEEAVFARMLYKATPAISARRQVLFDVGLFDETLKRRQDMDLVLRLARATRCATTDEILWTKYWSEESISAKQNTFMAATIEICNRYPDYSKTPAFRTGLARDIARHFGRLIATGDISTARANLAELKTYFGGMPTARLIGRGIFEILKRQSRKLIRPAKPTR